MNITNFLSFDFSFFTTPLGIILIVLAIVLVLCILILLIGGKKKGDDSHEELVPENDLNQDNIEVPSATEQMQMMASSAVQDELKDVQKQNTPDVFTADAPAETAAEKAANYESIKEEQYHEAPAMPEREVVPAVNHDEEAPAMVTTEEKQEEVSYNRSQEPAPYGGLDPAANINLDFAQDKTPYGGVDPQHGTQQLSPKFFDDVKDKEKADEVMMPRIMGMGEETSPSVEVLPNAEVNSVNPYQMPAEAGLYNEPTYVNKENTGIAEVPSMPHEETFPSNEVNSSNNSQVDFYNNYDNLYARAPEETNAFPANNNPYPASDSFYAERAGHPVDNLNPYETPSSVNNSQNDYYNVNSTNYTQPSVNQNPQSGQANNYSSYDSHHNDIETL